MQGEHQLCLHCLTDLRSTFYSPYDDNPVEKRLAGLPHLEHATSLFLFQQGGTVQRLIHAMKFHGNSDLCLLMGRRMGLDLLQSGRFDDVDLLVPVPLHWRRRLQRGYNQSELLCRGIAQTFPRPVDSRSVRRHRHTHQQSLQTADDRLLNVKGAFSVRHPADLENRHILLVDDVLTTGATLASCCQALSTIKGIKISIATLSIAGM